MLDNPMTADLTTPLTIHHPPHTHPPQLNFFFGGGGFPSIILVYRYSVNILLVLQSQHSQVLSAECRSRYPGAILFKIFFCYTSNKQEKVYIPLLLCGRQLIPYLITRDNIFFLFYTISNRNNSYIWTYHYNIHYKKKMNIK